MMNRRPFLFAFTVVSETIDLLSSAFNMMLAVLALDPIFGRRTRRSPQLALSIIDVVPDGTIQPMSGHSCRGGDRFGPRS